MYIGDINFDYSRMSDYKSYSPPCKAEFSIYGSFEEMVGFYRLLKASKFRRGTRVNKIADVLPKVILKAICDEMSDKMIDELRRDAYMPINGSSYGLLCYTDFVKISPIKKVIFHDPATIVYWQDKTRTVVKCKDGETFDKEKGLAMCISKKLLGDDFHSEFRKYTEDNK